MAKRKSVRWSLKDIKKIEEFVKNAVALGGTEKDGLIDAAKHFGVTKNAVQCRLWKYKRGLSTGGLKQKTTKKAFKRKPYGKRGPYKKRKSLKFKEDKSPLAAALAKRLVAESNRLVFPVSLLSMQVPKIKELVVDFDARSITYTY